MTEPPSTERFDKFAEHDANLFAIWPHDLLSKTVWAARWLQNPYSQLIDVDDVYSDSLVWEYQKQKYRYMIARFAHSRSMGVWELINEMNGTDGWASKRFWDNFDKPAIFGEAGADLYVMGTSNNALGWGRSYKKDIISGSELHVHGLESY